VARTWPPCRAAWRSTAANRANALKSTGPVSHEGKARSAKNSLKHGVLAGIVTLRNENPIVFDAAVQTYVNRFQPQDDVERDMINQLVAAIWRLGRCYAMETRMLDCEMDNHASAPTEIDRTLAAFKSLAPTKEMNLVLRYQHRLATLQSRLIRDLNALRRNFPVDPAALPPAHTPEPAGPTAEEKISPNEATKPPALNKTAPEIDPHEPTTAPIDPLYDFPTCDPLDPEDLK